MHENAVNKLNAQIVGMLKNCKIADSWFEWESVRASFRSIAKELSRHKSEHIKEDDVYSILSELLFDYITEQAKIPKEVSGRLQELVGEERLIQLAENITSYLVGIPHSVSAELEFAQLTSAVEAHKEVGHAVQVGFRGSSYFGDPNLGGLGLMTAMLSRKSFFIRVAAKGAASWSIESTTNRALVSSLKILLHHAIDQKLIEVKDRGVVAQGIFTHAHQISRIKIKTTENAIWTRENSIELPLEICMLLDRMAAGQAGENYVSNLLGCFEVPVKLLESQDEASLRIKSAIEWSLDSLTAENETMAFLKACIGLEALLGESESGGALTESLADRCAYLIATSIRSRKSIRDRFKDLYKVRSKIVHGAISHLDRANRVQLDFARHFLVSAIRREMQLLMP